MTINQQDVKSAWFISGLSELDQEIIKSVINNTPGILEVVLFGSRALGTAKPGSDVDLIIRCDQDALPAEIVRALSVALNEQTKLPYRFDIIAFELTTHRDLLAHIQKFGKTIWRCQRGY